MVECAGNEVLGRSPVWALLPPQSSHGIQAKALGLSHPLNLQILLLEGDLSPHHHIVIEWTNDRWCFEMLSSLWIRWNWHPFRKKGINSYWQLGWRFFPAGNGAATELKAVIVIWILCIHLRETPVVRGTLCTGTLMQKYMIPKVNLQYNQKYSHL